MREYLFHGKRVDNGEWVEGYLGYNKVRKQYYIMDDVDSFPIPVHKESVGEWTGLADKNGRKIFEGDIVQYQTYDDFDCQSVVKFGVYTQDGSGGEYAGKRCLGFYVYVDNFTCPDWCEDDPNCFPEYLYQQNINDIAVDCEVIGTVFENADLLEGRCMAKSVCDIHGCTRRDLCGAYNQTNTTTEYEILKKEEELCNMIWDSKPCIWHENGMPHRNLEHHHMCDFEILNFRYCKNRRQLEKVVEKKCKEYLSSICQERDECMCCCDTCIHDRYLTVSEETEDLILNIATLGLDNRKRAEGD